MTMKQTRTFTQCPECGTPYTTGSGMARHRQAKHGLAPIDPKAGQARPKRNARGFKIG